MASRYDDDLWGLVPADPGPPPEHLVRFARELGDAARALDVGCGDGRLSAELRAGSLAAADVSAVALERARRRLPHAQIVELEPDQPLPFSDSVFDLVLCAETLEHVRDVQMLLSEARRVLRSRGRLAITTPAHSRLTGLDLFARGLEERLHPLSPHIRFLTRRSLRRLLVDMGFDPESIRRRRGSLLAVARR